MPVDKGHGNALPLLAPTQHTGAHTHGAPWRRDQARPTISRGRVVAYSLPQATGSEGAGGPGFAFRGRTLRLSTRVRVGRRDALFRAPSPRDAEDQLDPAEDPSPGKYRPALLYRAEERAEGMTTTSRHWSRREVVHGLSLTGPAGLVSFRAGAAAAEPPPETTTLRFAQGTHDLCRSAVRGRGAAAGRGVHRRAVHQPRPRRHV